jgi:hypothetical protein
MIRIKVRQSLALLRFQLTIRGSILWQGANQLFWGTKATIDLLVLQNQVSSSYSKLRLIQLKYLRL